MNFVYLSLGANIGEPKAQLKQALILLEEHNDIIITKKSKIITTKAWGKTDQNNFLNMVVEIKTSIYPERLLEICLKVEKSMGRERNEKWGPRLIDIDIIAYEKIEVKTKNLTLPHPHAFERDFVLNPLREIAPRMANWIIEQAK